MSARPKLKAAVSRKDFRTAMAEMATDFARHIELNVEAFSSDPAAKAERLARVIEPEGGFQFFMETYLPHYVRGEHSLFHQAIFAKAPKILGSKKGLREMFIAPRGSSKSTHLSLGFALYCIMTRRTRYMLEVCDVYAQAALLIEAIKAELTTNPRLQNDFPDACGQGRVWREGEIVTRQNIRVEGLGAMQKLRGRRHGPYRPDLMFFDDIENDEAVRSPEQRQKLQNWINRAALKVGPPDGSMHVIWVGTVLHFDAVLVRAAKSPVWNVTEFQAIVTWPDRMDLWEQFEEIWQNAGGGESEAEARAFYEANKAEMDRGAVVNWPAVQPLVWLMLERAGSHDAFQTEYQNKPISEGNPFGDLTWWVQPLREWLFFGAIDPSLGKNGNPSKRPDSGACLMPIDPHRNAESMRYCGPNAIPLNMIGPQIWGTNPTEEQQARLDAGIPLTHMWQGEMQMEWWGMYASPELFARGLRSSFPRLEAIRVPFNLHYWTRDEDGKLNMSPLMERFFEECAEDRSNFLLVWDFHDGPTQSLNNAINNEHWPSSYPIKVDNLDDFHAANLVLKQRQIDTWQMLFEWLYDRPYLQRQTLGYEVKNEPAAHANGERKFRGEPPPAGYGSLMQYFVGLWVDNIASIMEVIDQHDPHKFVLAPT